MRESIQMSLVFHAEAKWKYYKEENKKTKKTIMLYFSNANVELNDFSLKLVFIL